MNDEELKRAIIEFTKKYYKRYKKGPSVRTILKKFKGERRIQERFYHIFGGIANACKQAEIPISEEQIKQTRKAFEAREKKRVEEASPLQDLKQSYQIQQREEQRRKEFAEKRAKEMAILLQDSNEAISRPVLDAMEKTVLPILLKRNYGIDASVPEILEMLKQYKQAKDEGWYAEYAMEWGILSEEEREAFRELYNKAYSEEGVNPIRYLGTLKDKAEKLSIQKEKLTQTNQRLQREEANLNERCSRLNRWLEEDYQQKKKSLEEKYLRDIDGCKVEFLKFKGKVQAMKKKLIDDYKGWETKRDNLIAKCDITEKRVASLVEAAKDSLDKIKAETAETVKERDTARGELKQLRAFVGPKGIVADLEKRNDDLKQQLAEKDRQLAEKAMQIAGKWLNQEEAIQKAEGVYRFVLDEVERRIETAGPALYVLEFLESELPDEKFKELTFAINMAQVKRESQNPDNPYFANIPLKKKKLLGAFPNSIEEYKRLHNEKMERLEKHRRTMLNQIRRDAMGFGIATRTVFGLLDEVMKPVAEAYFNPKKPSLTTQAKSAKRKRYRNS